MTNERKSKLRRNADQGDAEAQYTLGELYYSGENVPQDFMMARGWYEKAAVQGHAAAQTGLGTLYFSGRGVSQDYAEAAKWFHLAAVQGHAVAQRKK